MQKLAQDPGIAVSGCGQRLYEQLDQVSKLGSALLSTLPVCQLRPAEQH